MAKTLIDEERKRLSTFLKYFAVKAAQIIIQSRDGLKIAPPDLNLIGKDLEKHNWFNLYIPDNERISSEVKYVLKDETENSLRQMLCIDVSLKFHDGFKFLLETWTLDLTPEVNTDCLIPINETYSKMSMLLKSLICITRTQPAYKISRKQSEEQYTMTYSMYCGNPHYERLGKQTKRVNAGTLYLHMGTVKLAVVFTMNLTLNRNKANQPFDSKTQNALPNERRRESLRRDGSGRKTPDLTKPLSAGAFVDKDKIDELHKVLQGNLPPEPPMGWLLSSIHGSSDSGSDKTKSIQKELEEAAGGDMSSKSSRSKAIEVPSTSKATNSYHKKLEFPFADGSPITELASFYQECIVARAETGAWYDAEDDDKNACSDSDTLADQFKAFQDAIPEFDNMVASMFSNSSGNSES